VLIAATTGCAVFYPEVETPIRPASASAKLEPPPPPDLFYVAVTRAEVPPRTRGGQPWDEIGGAPDPYAIVFINGEELLRTTTQSDSYEPTWPESPKKNYTIPKDATLKVELWNDNPINAQPICVQSVRRVRREAAETGEIDLYCDGGARVTVEFRPAKARWGLGFFYELRGDGAAVTRVFKHSPASRAGLRPGDQFVSINGRKVSRMDEKRVRSAINANVKSGLKLEVRSGGETRLVNLEEGPIYALERN
jgi:hypothetical protein